VTNYDYAGENWRFAGWNWERTWENSRSVFWVWGTIGILDTAIRAMENSATDFKKAGNTDEARDSQAEEERLEDRKLIAILTWSIATIILIAIALSAVLAVARRRRK
jgi:hypothetical protein